MTAATLRPNGSSGGMTVVGAASIEAALADASNSSYVYGAPGNTTLQMTTVALPAGAVTSTVTGRMTVKSVSGGCRITFAGPSYPIELWSLFDSGGVWEDSSTGPVAMSLTQAQLDAFTIDTLSDGVNEWLSAVYLDIVYVAQPVVAVTAVTPDPYTASSFVPISWVNTLDADGGAPTRYRIKAFSAAQYGIGGFDPETSPSTYDSGEKIGSASSAFIGPLPTGVTYRAYVKVAQTVNGVSHWSAWAYDGFAVDVVTADVASVTAVGSNAGAYIEVTVARNIGSFPWSFVEVERSVDNGATWAPVRGATYVAPSGDSFVVKDHETGNAQAALYRARATYVSGLPITGDWVQSSTSASWSSPSPQLKSLANPAKNLALDIDTPFVTINRTNRAGVFDVIGKANRVLISDVMSGIESVLMIRTRGDDAMVNLLNLLADIVLLYHPTACEGGTTGRYIAITGVSEATTIHNKSLYRMWSVPYVEIDAPGDPLASAP